jgi:CheY-like chemotaxis protein
MAEEQAAGNNIEKGARVGVPGGTQAIRPTSNYDTELSPAETASYEKLIGKPGAHGAPVPVPGEGKCALIVEDDPHIRRLIASMLERLGCRQLEVADGNNALKAFVKYKVDLAIIDLKIPGLDGYQVIRGARSYLKIADTPILVISGLTDVEYEAAALNIGADGFLGKPFDLIQLEGYLRAGIRSRV